MESIVITSMKPALRQIITPAQHGFMPKRSTCTQLLDFTHYVLSSLDRGSGVDAIYLDFQKAFDSVCHRRLLQVCEGYGFKEELVRWIEAFLQNRTQRVRVNQTFSRESPVLSGVPQGSCLGPFLFILYINEIVEIVNHSKTWLYADDVKLAINEDTPNSQQLLQEDLNNIIKWCEVRQLCLSPNKCQAIHCGKTKVIPQHNYLINGQPLTWVERIRDLGLTLTADFKWQAHWVNMTRKAIAMINCAFRAFTHTPSTVLIKIFKCMTQIATRTIEEMG